MLTSINQKNNRNGIYKREGSTLMSAGSEPGVESRPTSFDPSEGIRIFQSNLKRESTALGL